jgi:HD-like signal output (HDOD) protein
MMLGFVTVRTLVISSGLTRGFKSMPGIDLPDFWRYSMHAAATARWLAKTTNQNTDQAFTLGLMHAIGQLIMHSGMAEAMFQVDKQADPLDARRFALESGTFGYHFGNAGAELARQWKFPPSFATSLDTFDNPLSETPPDKMALVLNIAAWRARVEYQGMNLEAQQATMPVGVCEALGLDAQKVLQDMPPMSELCEGLEALVE